MARACPHWRRRWLPCGDSSSTPRSMLALERKPQVRAPTPNKVLGPVIDRRGIPRGPLATRKSTGIKYLYCDLNSDCVQMLLSLSAFNYLRLCNYISDTVKLEKSLRCVVLLARTPRLPVVRFWWWSAFLEAQEIVCPSLVLQPLFLCSCCLAYSYCLGLLLGFILISTIDA